MTRRQAGWRAAGRRSVVAAGVVLSAVATLAAVPADGRTVRRADVVTPGEGTRIAAAAAARAGIGWGRCPAGWGLPDRVECGRVTVPLDYTRPYGAVLRLAVDRARATGPRAGRQGALLYNPGGPGGSGLSFPRRVTTHNPLWTAVAAAYDFVGFDPRGVGRSGRFSCQDPAVFAAGPKPDPVPRDAADKRAHRAAARRYAAGCARRGGPPAAHLDTPDLARDLDVLRAALGERRLNYLGVSYGTYLGAVYATLFPGHVRRMVVDSVVDPDPSRVWYGDNLAQDVAFQNRWADWTDWVARYDAAYHLGRTRAAVEHRWRRLRAAAARRPVDGDVGPAELTGFFQNAPYYDAYWPLVAHAWSEYAAGRPGPLTEAAKPPAGAGAVAAENGTAVYTAVECGDAVWPAAWRVWDRDSTRLHVRHPFLTWANTWLNLPCATWPGPRRAPVDVRSRAGLPRVLIVQSVRDAATPYAGALELHRRLGGSRLVTERDAGSHGVTGLVNPCVNHRVTAYLLEGETDPRDVVCPPHAPPRPVPTAREPRTPAAPGTVPDLPGTV